jgi:hypothetical protein
MYSDFKLILTNRTFRFDYWFTDIFHVFVLTGAKMCRRQDHSHYHI